MGTGESFKEACDPFCKKLGLKLSMRQVLEAAKPQDIGPRRRKQISYNEDRLQKGTALEKPEKADESDYANVSSDGSTSADEVRLLIAYYCPTSCHAEPCECPILLDSPAILDGL